MPQVVTALGRVQMLYKGEYNSGTTYQYLDNVTYQGNSYVSKQDYNSGHTPPVDSPYSNEYWGLIAKKGDKGDKGSTGNTGAAGPTGAAAGFGTPTATVTTIEDPSAPATVSVVASGDSASKVFSFAFGIPRAAAGTGSVSSVDTIQANSSDGNVALHAVRYTSGWGSAISTAEKEYARENIGAAAAAPTGLAYIAASTSVPSTGQVLQYSNAGVWEGATINLVPTGNSEDVGKYLRKGQSGLVWANVQTLPSGGYEGAPLVKNSDDDYDVTWGSIATLQDIDGIFNPPVSE